MAKRTYYKGSKIDVWQGMDNSWCFQVDNNRNNRTEAGHISKKTAMAEAKLWADKFHEGRSTVFKLF